MQDAPGPDADDADVIRLTVPAHADYARVVRLAVSGLASRNGFAYDDVEDIRIAVGEVFAILAPDHDPEARLRFSTGLRGGGLAMDAERVPAAAVDRPPPLSEQILAAVVGEIDLDVDRGRLGFTKRFPS